MAEPGNTLILETTKGKVVIEMRPDLAPDHVDRIKELVREGFYDGVVFHRVIDGFMAQTGCPHGTGIGGSNDPNLKAEFNSEPHVRGTGSMARAQNPNSANSQFFICFDDAPLPQPAVHGLGQGDRRHGERRQDQARRAGAAIPTRSSSREGTSVDLAADRADGMMRVDLFDFELPEDRIALRPAEPRDAARLLVVTREARRVRGPLVARPARLLRPGDVLVFNDTRVIPAQLDGLRVRGDAVAQIEATLHMRDRADRWRAFARPAKRLQVGDRIRFGHDGEDAASSAALDATVVGKGEAGEVHARLRSHRRPRSTRRSRARARAAAALYRRAARDDARDRADYQTIYARHEARSPRRPPACISRRSCSRRLDDARHRRARDAACRRRHVPAGQGRRHRAITACMPNGARFRRDGRRAECGADKRRPRSWRSARRRCGCWKAPRDEDGTSTHWPARPRSSSRPATASAPSTR